jgi:hypothetical protein
VVAVLDAVVAVGEPVGPLPVDEREMAVVRQVTPEVGNRAADDLTDRTTGNWVRYFIRNEHENIFG